MAQELFMTREPSKNMLVIRENPLTPGGEGEWVGYSPFVQSLKV